MGKNLNRDFNKTDKKDKLKIQFTQKQIIQNLEENNLKSKLAKETPIVIVLDNYKPHRNQDLKKNLQNTKYNLSTFTAILTTTKSNRTSLEIN